MNAAGREAALGIAADCAAFGRGAANSAARLAGIRGLVLGCVGGFGAGRHRLLQISISW
jgi:hypothetical protein